MQTGGAEAASVFEDWEDSLDKVADTADGVAETLGGLFEELKTQQIIDDLEEMTRIEREAADEAEAWAEWLQEQRIEGILKGLEQAGREAEEQLRKAELPSLPGAAERGTQEAFRAIMEARREDPALRLEQEQLRELQRLVNDSKRVWEALTNWEPVKEAIL